MGTLGSTFLTTRQTSKIIFTTASQVFTPHDDLTQVAGGPLEILWPLKFSQDMMSSREKVSGSFDNSGAVYTRRAFAIL